VAGGASFQFFNFPGFSPVFRRGSPCSLNRNSSDWRIDMKMSQRIVYLTIGALLALGLVFIVGAGPNGLHVGRYQISTCLKRDWVYVYVIDTATGIVKFVDEKNENKPFDEIKSSR
jgi:hypothetical protein